MTKKLDTSASRSFPCPWWPSASPCPCSATVLARVRTKCNFSLQKGSSLKKSPRRKSQNVLHRGSIISPKMVPPQPTALVLTMLAMVSSSRSISKIPSGVIGSGGYPRAIETTEGEKLLCTGSGGGLVVAAASPSANATAHLWVQRGAVVHDNGPGVDLANCILFEVERGRLLAAYRYHTGCSERGRERFSLSTISSVVCTRYSIQVSQSHDGGRTWTYLSTPVHGEVGMWEPFFFPVAKGLQIAYVVPFYSAVKSTVNMARREAHSRR